MTSKLVLHDGSGGADIPYDGPTAISALLHFYGNQLKIIKELERSRTRPEKATIWFVAPDGSKWRITLDELS